MLSFKESSLKNNQRSSYDVLIESEKDGKISATVIGLPDCKSSGESEEEAIEKLKKLLQERLQQAKIITLEIESSQIENPWKQIVGMYKDNPLFEEVLDYIEVERQQLKAEMEAYYEQLDVEDKLK